MDNILGRIQEIARHEGITIGALERKIGASKGVLSRAISNGTDIQSKWIQIIVENYPVYSSRWLITGKGSMLCKEKSGTSNYIEPDILDNDSIAAEPNTMYVPDHRIYEKLYKDKDEETKKLIEEIGSLKEKIRHLEADRLNVENQDVSNASTKKSRKSNPPVTSVIARSKKL